MKVFLYLFLNIVDVAYVNLNKLTVEVHKDMKWKHFNNTIDNQSYPLDIVLYIQLDTIYN